MIRCRSGFNLKVKALKPSGNYNRGRHEFMSSHKNSLFDIKCTCLEIDHLHNNLIIGGFYRV